MGSITMPVLNIREFNLSVSDITLSISAEPYYHVLAGPIPAIQKPQFIKYLGTQ
jgi:hypothetical protein